MSVNDKPIKKYLSITITPSTAFPNNPHDDWTIHVNGCFVATVRGKKMASIVVVATVSRYMGWDTEEFEFDVDREFAKEDMKLMENGVFWTLQAEGAYHKHFTHGNRDNLPIEMEEFPHGRNKEIST